MQKLGSTKILAALIAAIHLTNKIDGSLEDQKITALEWGQYMTHLANNSDAKHCKSMKKNLIRSSFF